MSFTICVLFAFPLASRSQDSSPTTKDSLDKSYAEQLPRIPAVSPDKAFATFNLQPGFRMEQVATEPLVADPVAIAFDEFGRMYVAEMLGYSEDEADNLGQIRRLEDTDNDGRFDKSTVFVKGLSWPTAVTCWNGGVLIGVAPDILYCRDIDGDGISDSKEVVFTGFRRSNVQGLMNTFKWGLDNRIHGATSSSGADVKQLRHPTAKTLPLNRRDFAIEPLTMAMSATSGGGQHGLSFDPFGQKFVCSNSDHLQVIQFEDRYVARNPYIESPPNRISIAVDGGQATVYRSSPVEPWRIVRTRLRVQKLVPGPVEGGGTASGYFTGATGITIYRGNAFPAEFYGNAFVADCGSNLIHRKKLIRDQLKVVGQRQDDKGEFITSKDIWFRPVQMANAPDGTLYVCDMSREVIEHPKSLPPIIKKHLDLTSGRTQGRIYRVVPVGFKQPTDIAIGKLSNIELAEVLDHPNGWHRETAARLIYTRRAIDASEAMEKVAVHGKRSEGRVRAFYALAGIDQLNAKTLLAGLNDNDPQVRRHAIRLAEDTSLQSPAVVDRLIALAADDSLSVVLQLAFTLGEVRSPRRVDALANLVKRSGTIEDAKQAELIRFAIQTSTVDVGSELLDKILGASSRTLPQSKTFATALATQI
ncbi:MAG: putative membrane-bound dehydrogenase-like protein, partial [Pirellulaceae bacterium]